MTEFVGCDECGAVIFDLHRHQRYHHQVFLPTRDIQVPQPKPGPQPKK